MKKSQYLFSSEKLEKFPSDFTSLEFGNYFLYKHQDLHSFHVQKGKVEILILGLIINPLLPKQTGQEIAQYLVTFENKESFLKELENYSGRFVVFYKNEKGCISLNDFVAQRNLFYWFPESKTYLFSCEKLFLDTLNLVPIVSEEKKIMLEDPHFSTIKQQFLLGEGEWDDRFKKLIPNHYIDLESKKMETLPIFHLEELDANQLVEQSICLLRGSIESAVFQFDKVYQALTAGYDSRLILTASFPFRDKIQYFLFDRNSTSINNDIKIARKLSKSLGFTFKTISPKPVTDEFKKEFHQQFVIARDLPKHQNIQFFKMEAPPNSVNITGDGGEMIRNFRTADSFSSIEKTLKSLLYKPYPYNVESLENWFAKSRHFREKYGLEIGDQFFIEVSMPKWGAKWTLEQDFTGVEELNPFNNKRLIYSILLNTKTDERMGPKYDFVRKLMEIMVPTSTKLPFNPPTWKDYVKKLIPK
jgi:hypothetical protein